MDMYQENITSAPMILQKKLVINLKLLVKQIKKINTNRKGKQKMTKCNSQCEIYSRVTGYMRPVCSWNKGKREEFKDRSTYKIQEPVKADVA